MQNDAVPDAAGPRIAGPDAAAPAGGADAERDGRRIAAVLIDMDGTLVDSEQAWEDAEAAVCRRFDVAWTPADARDCFGKPLTYTARSMIDRGVRLTVGQAIEAMTVLVAERHAHDVPWLPGAPGLLAELAGAGVPCALVTMSPRVLADAVAAAAGGAITAVVSGDDVRVGKPDPEPYLTAAQALGVEPSACVAIEDSVSGVTSALAAGAVVVSVPSSTRDLAALSALPCVVADSITDLSLSALGAIAGSWKRP